jgi:hypothetical protein
LFSFFADGRQKTRRGLERIPCEGARATREAEAVQDPSVRAELLVTVSQYDERAERLEAQEREAEKPTRRDLTASRLRARARANYGARAYGAGLMGGEISGFLGQPVAALAPSPALLLLAEPR